MRSGEERSEKGAVFTDIDVRLRSNSSIASCSPLCSSLLLFRRHRSVADQPKTLAFHGHGLENNDQAKFVHASATAHTCAPAAHAHRGVLLYSS